MAKHTQKLLTLIKKQSSVFQHGLNENRKHLGWCVACVSVVTPGKRNSSTYETRLPVTTFDRIAAFSKEYNKILLLHILF